MTVVQGFKKYTSKTSVNCCSTLDNNFIVLIVVFYKQVNIRCSIGSIGRPRSSGNHKAADEVFAIDSYQSHFRKLDIFFSGKQEDAIRTDQKSIVFSTVFTWW